MAKRYIVEREKVTGILTELQAEADKVHSVIVGIGINANQRKRIFRRRFAQATSLFIELGEKSIAQRLSGPFYQEWKNYIKFTCQKV